MVISVENRKKKSHPLRVFCDGVPVELGIGAAQSQKTRIMGLPDGQKI